MSVASLRLAWSVGLKSRSSRLAGLLIAAMLAFDSSALAQSSPAGGGSPSGTLQPEHPLKPAIRIAQSSLEALDGVRDYECVFTKRELIDGQMTSQMMQMRFREQPFSVYYKFGPPFAGREVLYVAGRNNGMMLAHEGSGVKSLVGSVSLALDCPKAKSENRHPLTEGGMRNIVALLVKQWEHESAYGEIEVQFYPSARIGDVDCRVIEVSHPRPRRQFLYHVTRLYLDSDTNYPVRLENYGWHASANADPPLIEEYTFRNVRVNLGFTDREFDPANPEYSF